MTKPKEQTTKRFIAGAVCPQCNEIDKIVVFHDGEKSVSECVRCGFKQEAIDSKNAPDENSPSKKTKKVVWLTPKTDKSE